MARDTHIIATSCDVSAEEFGRLFNVSDGSLQHATTLVEVRKISEESPQSCIITDCKLSDVWFDTAFHWFDEAARDRPLIIMLRDAEQALKYRTKATHAKDIYPLSAIDDYRFAHVFPAALLRYDSVKMTGSIERLFLSTAL